MTAEPLPSRPAEPDVPVFEHGTVGEGHEAGTAGTRGVPDARGTPATSRRTQLGGFPPSFPEVASRARPSLSEDRSPAARTTLARLGRNHLIVSVLRFAYDRQLLPARTSFVTAFIMTPQPAFYID